MGPKMKQRVTFNNKPSGFVPYGPDIQVPARILTVSKARSARLPERPFLRAATGIAAFAIAFCAVTPADASLNRRMKFRAEQDAKRNVGPLIPPGQLHIMISIKSQRVAVYSDGILAAKSNVSTGVPDHPTPTGVFSVIQKNRHHRSNIYSDAPMPFMQRITWSGIALHQGNLPGRPASHGCIRLSQDFRAIALEAHPAWRARDRDTRRIHALYLLASEIVRSQKRRERTKRGRAGQDGAGGDGGERCRQTGR